MPGFRHAPVLVGKSEPHSNGVVGLYKHDPDSEISKSSQIPPARQLSLVLHVSNSFHEQLIISLMPLLSQVDLPKVLQSLHTKWGLPVQFPCDKLKKQALSLIPISHFPPAVLHWLWDVAVWFLHTPSSYLADLHREQGVEQVAVFLQSSADPPLDVTSYESQVCEGHFSLVSYLPAMNNVAA